MAKITWLGEDAPDYAGPSFTTCFGKKFPKGEAVEVNDPDMVRRASGNPFFSVEEEAETEDVGAEASDDGYDDMKIAELRNLADASGINHDGMTKSELRDALRKADHEQNAS